jgi:HlyD family secretion protein
VVAELDPAIFQASVHQAEGDLANARATLELQLVEAHRSAELFSNKLVSSSDYDKAIADLHSAEAQVKMKEASLERAKVDLAHCTIYAPVDGIVISRNVDVGQTVAASMNAPVLFVIANDLAKMQIDSNVSEADVGSVEDGQSVSFTVDAFPNRTFAGKVTQIRNSPITVQNVVTYDTVVGVDNADQKLKPGMTATISITTAQRANALKVPNAALRFRPPEPATNQTLVARWLSKIGIGNPPKSPSITVTNAAAKPGGTNQTDVAQNTPPPLTGNEPPEELMKRVREMRDRGEEPSPEIRAKLRELFQSGALQRPGGGGGGGMGGPGGMMGAGQRPRPAAPAWRTVYLLTTNTPAGGGEPVITPKPVRVKTGITDGNYTEITEGLDEGVQVITTVKLAQNAVAVTPNSAPNPFGGGGGGGRRF